MEKYIMVVTNEQIEKSKARKKAIEALEYNPMCYSCKNFGKSCKGSTNKVYSGCVYKEVDDSKPSIYAQIAEQMLGGRSYERFYRAFKGFRAFCVMPDNWLRRFVFIFLLICNLHRIQLY